MVASARFQEALDWGAEAERYVRKLLRSRGWWVIDTAKAADEGSAPLLAGPSGERSIVLPDLHCFRDGKARAFEVKRKKRAVPWDKGGGRRETGIDLRSYQDYLAYEQKSGTDVCLVFVHDEEREVRGDLLSILDSTASSHIDDKSRYGKGGMIYWQYDRIALWQDRVSIAQPAVDPYDAQPCDCCGESKPIMLRMQPGPDGAPWSLCGVCWRNTCSCKRGHR